MRKTSPIITKLMDPGSVLEKLGERIVQCKKCPRLTQYTSQVAKTKVKRYKDWGYWGRPLPGFGDPYAELLIIGLAPAAHGGNRTGRMFTGDSSGDWLIMALYETGFANQPLSIRRDDGLKLTSAYITATVRCAPPANKPKPEEIRNCSEYLMEELHLLRNVKVILTLGRMAFDHYLQYVEWERRPLFRHGAIYGLRDDYPLLVASYHPSRQNTQTKRFTWEAWIQVFEKIRCLLDHRVRS